jgi:hypothetical protein
VPLARLLAMKISDCVSMLLQEAFDGKDDRGADPEWSTV